MMTQTMLPTKTPKTHFVSKISTFPRNHSLLLLNLLLFGLAAVYIGPFRETSVSDDWSYILTASHLFYTGQYQLHPWSSANLLFQAAWGDLFALIGGFSIGTLHFSTLVLAVGGIIGMYGLALEHKMNRTQAGLLTLCLVSSPLVIYFTFTYMTDVPLLALLLLSLFFYTRALRLHSYWWMGVGSVTTIAAMYVRPTGLALVAGLGCLWLLDKNRFKLIPIYLTGITGPALAAFYLLFGGTLSNFQSGSFNGDGQSKYMKNIPAFLGEVFLWRPGIFLQYLALFALPLVIVSLVSLVRVNRPDNLIFVKPKVLLAIAVFVIASALYSRFIKGESFLMPYLPWNLSIVERNYGISVVVTLLTILGAIFFGSIFWQRLHSWSKWLALPIYERLLDLVTVFLLLYHLLFFNIGDRYLFVLIPFAFIVVGRHLKVELVQFRRWLLASSCVILILASFWTCSELSVEEAQWKASDYALSLGVNPRYISAPWGWYSSYNFSSYLKERPDKTDINYLFDTWLPERDKEASYLIVNDLEAPPGESWQLMKKISYRSSVFKEQFVYVVKRVYLR